MMRVFKFMLAFFMTIASCSNIDQYTDKKICPLMIIACIKELSYGP